MSNDAVTKVVVVVVVVGWRGVVGVEGREAAAPVFVTISPQSLQCCHSILLQVYASSTNTPAFEIFTSLPGVRLEEVRCAVRDGGLGKARAVPDVLCCQECTLA
jgi:hypothetical protein